MVVVAPKGAAIRWVSISECLFRGQEAPLAWVQCDRDLHAHCQTSTESIDGIVILLLPCLLLGKRGNLAYKRSGTCRWDTSASNAKRLKRNRRHRKQYLCWTQWLLADWWRHWYPSRPSGSRMNHRDECRADSGWNEFVFQFLWHFGLIRNCNWNQRMTSDMSVKRGLLTLTSSCHWRSKGMSVYVCNRHGFAQAIPMVW